MARGGARRTATHRRKSKVKHLESDFSSDEDPSCSDEGEEAGAMPAGKEQEGIRSAEEQSIVAGKGTSSKIPQKRPRLGGDKLKAGSLDERRRKKAKQNADGIAITGPSSQGSKGGKEKGKEKVVEEEVGKALVVQALEEVCGICLVEEGEVDRGMLDCCDHYFCYTCIMEWAKVESRCPMCKQRFAKIVRPATSATGRKRTVRIPLRNQVYIPSEEDISQYGDPYASVVCMECHEAGDERFLLLCDFCDAAAHAYCVGLGRSVPRGDWFCRSCQTLMPQSSLDEEDDIILGFSSDDEDGLIRAIVATSTPVQKSARQTSTRPITSTRTRPRMRGVRRRLWRRLTHRRSSATSSFIFSQCMRSTVRDTIETSGNNSSQTLSQSTSTARTVTDQRRLQERIQFIRDNWEEIRTSARQFPPGGYNTSSSPLILQSANEVTINSSEPQSKPSNSSCDLSELPLSCQETEVAGCKKEDLACAWDMLEQAKTLGEFSSAFDRQERIQCNQDAKSPSKTSPASQEVGSTLHLSTDREKMNSVSHSVLQPIKFEGKSGPGETSHNKPVEGNKNYKKECTTGSASNLSENNEPLDIVSARNKELDIRSSCSAQATLFSKEFENNNHAISQVIGKCNVAAEWSQLQSSEVAKSTDFRSEPSISFLSSGARPEVPDIFLHQHCSIVRPNDIVAEVKNKNEKGFALSHEGIGLANENVCVDNQDIVCKNLVDVAVPKEMCAVGSSGTSHEERPTICKAASLSECKQGSVVVEKTSNDRSVKAYVADLVKRELWPIYLSKGLGKDQFKDIARSATHTLLALCGLGHHTSDFPQVQVLACCHKELQAQSLVANYCDICFKVQVKAVVRTVAHKSPSFVTR